MDLTGQTLGGRYDVVRLIGEGGMGQVYEARHVELQRLVAVKVLERELVGDEELQERFRREARITASLRHVNIIEVMDFGLTDDGQPYIVMELLEGESLAELLEREGALGEREAREILAQVLAGLAEAHSLGIIHRDLKPDNVFIDEVKGVGRVVKLLDFGISKLYGEQKEEQLQLTRTGTVMGTPYYMSPEQVMGNQELDTRSDIYACGVMLFEMVTGGRPFEGTTHNEVVVRIMSDDPPDARDRNPTIPIPLSAIMNKAMTRDRAHRYQGAEEFLTAIQTLDPGERTESFSTISLTSIPAQREKKPNRWIIPVVVGAGVVALTLMSAIVIGSAVGLAGSCKPKTVLITPRGAPENASIVLDGTMIPAEPFELPMGDEPITFSLEADGHLPGQFEVIPDEDKQIRVYLESKKAKKKASAKSGGDDPDKDDSAPKKKKKKKTRNPFKKLVRKLKK